MAGTPRLLAKAFGAAMSVHKRWRLADR